MRPQDFPVVSGAHRVTAEWSIELPGEFRRRAEDGSLVLWRPGLTVRADAWGRKEGGGPEDALRVVQDDASPDRFDEREERSGGFLRYAYRLAEDAGDERVPAFYGFVIGPAGHVGLGIYFDDEGELGSALAVWRGVRQGT